MNRAGFFLALLSCFVALDALACSCAFSSDFAHNSGSVVIAGTVREYLRAPRLENRPYAMEVEVETVLRGEYRARRIIIWGDLGMSCVPYVTRFPIGTKWVFAISGPTTIPDFGDENYHFGMCETDWLRWIDGMTVEELKRIVTAQTPPARGADRPARRRDNR